MDEYDSRPDPRLEVSICQENGLYDLNVGENGFKFPGLVLIFNQIDFRQTPGDEDVERRLEQPGLDLQELMTELGFKVFYCRNYKRVQIMNTIGKYATLRRKDKKEYASFLLFFLSHGNMKIFENDFHEIIKTADDDMLISDIWKHFERTDTWNCKPKCFFFQTCRGQDLIEGVKVINRKHSNAEKIMEDGDHHLDEPKLPEPQNRSSKTFDWNMYDFGEKKDILIGGENFVFPYGINRVNFPDEHDRHRPIPLNSLRPLSTSTCSIPFTEPKFSDLLIFHSTYQGASSFRENDYSPFVNAVLTNFRKDFFQLDLFSIMQNVQKDIAYTFHASHTAQRDAAAYECTEIEGSRLMPMIESTLTGKICYQNPENIKVASIRYEQELPKYYDMKSGKGRAVIFAYKYNQMDHFPPMPYVVPDISELEKSFEFLNCKTTLHWDLTKTRFLNALNDLGSEDFSEYDFFCLVFYGYGLNDQLIVRNNQSEFIEDYVELSELWQPFLGSRCQTLIDKPKFFIVSAIGIEKPGISGKFKRFVKKAINIENTRALNLEASCPPGATPQMYVIPEAADFLLLFHTASGTAKYMDFMDDDDEDDLKIQSSFFQKLNEELQNQRNFVGDRHLLYLIRRFQYKMTLIIKDNVKCTRESQNKCEVPVIFSTLTKNFVLEINQNSS